MNTKRVLQWIEFDGFNLGFADSFARTYLVFDSFKEIAKHYIDWMFQ